MNTTITSVQDLDNKPISKQRVLPFTLLTQTLKGSLCLVLIFITLLLLFQLRALKSILSPSYSFSWPFFPQALHNNGSSCADATVVELIRTRSMLRESVTFLPLKDLRFSKEPTKGHTWFMSSMNDTHEDDGDSEYLYFPSEASKGRLLCLSAGDVSNGAKNSYALAWPEALPANATLLGGLTFVSETYYDYENLWHGLSALMPFVSWHDRKRSAGAPPARWVLFHWGELRSSMGTWVRTLSEAAIGEVRIQDLSGYGGAPMCFEKAVVFRHNEGLMTKERKEEVYDVMRCKARAYCKVCREADDGYRKGSAAIGMTLLLRLGARSFKNESGVIRIFEKECEKVDGCRVKVAWGNNMTFCEQVKLMSETDILVSPHGAQMTNLFFMEKNSSIMEFYPKGWKKFAGDGQFVFRWMAEWAGMRHRGSWWDPEGEQCPHDGDKLKCFSFYKDIQIGHDAAHFGAWAAEVLNEVKEHKLNMETKHSSHAQLNHTSCPCS